jgi:hypothetical protein
MLSLIPGICASFGKIREPNTESPSVRSLVKARRSTNFPTEFGFFILFISFQEHEIQCRRRRPMLCAAGTHFPIFSTILIQSQADRSRSLKKEGTSLMNELKKGEEFSVSADFPRN